MVLVNVSVLDSHNRPVTGLSREQFHVLDNGREQPIQSFGHDDAPVSVAIILDSSGSMERNWKRARVMLANFCDNLEPRDEMFVVTVQQRPTLLADYTNDCPTLQSQLLSMKTHGSTALLDAIPLSVEHLRKAASPRRVILIISDGGENASRTRVSEIRQLAREANAQLYAATLGPQSAFQQIARDPDAGRGPKLLAEIADLTGGRAFGIDDFQQISTAAAALAREIHDQYVIGYQSPDPGTDGKHHRIGIKVSREPGTPRLSLSYRTSYQSPLK